MIQRAPRPRFARLLALPPANNAPPSLSKSKCPPAVSGRMYSASTRAHGPLQHSCLSAPIGPNLRGYPRAGQGCHCTRGASLPLMRPRVAPTIGPPARCCSGACAHRCRRSRALTTPGARSGKRGMRRRAVICRWISPRPAASTRSFQPPIAQRLAVGSNGDVGRAKLGPRVRHSGGT